LDNSPNWRLAGLNPDLVLRCGWGQEFTFLYAFWRPPRETVSVKEADFRLNAETALYLYTQLEHWYKTHGYTDSAAGIVDLKTKLGL
jgi:hypothetical protein